MSDTFRTFDPTKMSPRDAYRLLLSLVVPRPIGWISTVSLDGVPNLAPYSFFNIVAGTPPTVMIAPNVRRGVGEKDTLSNVREVPEMVIHIVDEAHGSAMNESSREFDPGIDEFTATGLATIPADHVRPLRIASAPVAMEAHVVQLVPVVDSAYVIVIARLVAFHVADDLVRADGLVDPTKLRPIARLGGEEYAGLGSIFELTRFAGFNAPPTTLSDT